MLGIIDGKEEETTEGRWVLSSFGSFLLDSIAFFNSNSDVTSYEDAVVNNNNSALQNTLDLIFEYKDLT